MKPLIEQLEELLAEAQTAYSDPKRDFTLVAVPCHTENDTGGLRFNICKWNSPDAWQVRENIFYTPWSIVSLIGAASLGDHRSFSFLALGERTPTSHESFADFCRRSTACLTAVGFGIGADPVVTWAAALFCTRDVSVRVSQSGPRTLSHPWGASVVVLCKMLKKLRPEGTHHGSVPNRMTCNPNDWTVHLDGRELARVRTKDQLEFVAGIAKADPNPISFKRIFNGNSKGKNPTRILKSLPPEVRRYIVGGKLGYRLKLPADNRHT